MTLVWSERDPDYRRWGLSMAYTHLGRTADADALLSALTNTPQTEFAYEIAQIYAYRGQLDQAFDWLHKAYNQHAKGIKRFYKPQIGLDPLMINLRADARYLAFQRQYRVPDRSSTGRETASANR